MSSEREPRSVAVHRSSDESFGGAMLWLSLDDLQDLGVGEGAKELAYRVEGGGLELRAVDPWDGNADESSVYFIGNGRGHFKIGVSESPQQRLEKLQVGNADQLEIVHTIDYGNSLTIESMLHEIFRSKNVRGEWFEMPPEVIDEIASFPEYGPTLLRQRLEDVRDGMAPDFQRRDEDVPD